MDKYALAHNRIRKLAKLLRKQKLLKQAGYMPYALGGGLGAAAGGGIGALIGGKKHRGLGAGIGAGAGAGLGLLGAYLSQNAFGNTDNGVAVPPPASAPANPPASTPAPDNPSNPATTSAAQSMSTPTAITKPEKSTSTTSGRSGFGDTSDDETWIQHLEDELSKDPDTDDPLDMTPSASAYVPDPSKPHLDDSQYIYPQIYTEQLDDNTDVPESHLVSVYDYDIPDSYTMYDSISRGTVGPTRFTDTRDATMTALRLARAINRVNNTPSVREVPSYLGGEPKFESNFEEELRAADKLNNAIDAWRDAQEKNTIRNGLVERAIKGQQEWNALRDPEVQMRFRRSLRRGLDKYDLLPQDIMQGVGNTYRSGIQNWIDTFRRVLSK